MAFFAEIPDRTAAESAIRAILLVEHDEQAAPTEADAWYNYQLVALQVIRDGTPVGTVTRVDHLPAQDLLAIETDRGEVLLPFVKQFVAEVDLNGGRILITPPAGLFESLPDDEE